MYIFSKIVVGAIYSIIFRMKVYGKENLPATGGCIICSNHSSNHDIVVLGLTAFKRRPVFMAKKELFKNPIVAWILNGFKPIPVDRDNPGTGTFKKVLEVLKEGKAFAIYIQGTRKKEIDVADTKSGVALFALKSEAPVIPVHIQSTFKLFSRINVYIGEAITFEEYYGKRARTEDLNTVAEKIMDAIIKLPDEVVVKK